MNPKLEIALQLIKIALLVFGIGLVFGYIHYHG